MALICREMEEADAFITACASTGEVEDPANGSPLEAEHVVFDSGGEISVVEGGIGGEGLFGPCAGFFAVAECAEVFFVDHEGVIRAHAADKGFDIQSTGVLAISFESVICDGSSLIQPVFEGLTRCLVRTEARAVIEAVLIGEELDVDDVESLELVEKKGRSIGGWPHGVFRVGYDPLLEFHVGVLELEVVHVPIALIESRSGKQDRRGKGSDGDEQEEGEGGKSTKKFATWSL